MKYFLKREINSDKTDCVTLRKAHFNLPVYKLLTAL